MAQVQESNKGGKRNLNAELNLVPFIDLLSVCICFLLMAAVWLQIGTVRVKQALGEDAPTPPKEAYELAIQLTDVNAVTLELKKGSKSSGKVNVAGASKEELTEKLFSEVEKKVAEVGAQQDETGPMKIQSATVAPNEKVNYGSMIAVMDVLRKREIVNIAVMPRM